MAITKTIIQCQNIAPILNLSKEISSNSLKIGVFANNGSGKTFISRLFRLTEKGTELSFEGKCLTDRIVSLGKNDCSFSFKIIDSTGTVKENFKIEIRKGQIPLIPKTEYIYHTFNQDYVEDNIKALSYDKNSEIEGFILGKVNIDLKEEEEELERIIKEGKVLATQIEKEINDYVKANISNIQDIKRLNEYKNLEYLNILGNVDKEKYDLSATFEDLIDNYNKIKSVPENLENIKFIEIPKVDFSIIAEIKNNCSKEYSLSSLAEDFKNKLKNKQDFIELGMELLNENEKSKCPFCEQKIQDKSLELIDQYTKYLNDTEAKTIKQFRTYIEILEKYIENVKYVENLNSKRVNEFNIYKTKYIPSSVSIELDLLDTNKIIDALSELISLNLKKLESIDKKIVIEDQLIQSLENYTTSLKHMIELNNKEIENINNKKNKIGEESKAVRKDICKSAYNYLLDTHSANIKTVLKLREDYKKLSEDIKKKKEQQKVSKRAKVASTIKTVLNYFFADKYSLDEESFRLIFYKNTLEKNQARDILSEGEKNIVAFAYYIGDTHLKVETEDDYKKIFFIIDDPISSMDFSHVYTLCGVIRDISKIIDKLERERLLIFTHNNDFMRVLATNNIVDKRLLLKNSELKEFNNNLTVPYIVHLIDIYKIARLNDSPTHTTANSIRHIIETLTKFEKIDISTDSIAEYIRENIPDDKKSYTLINDLSHGGWRTEQAPITDDEYAEVCEALVKHIEYKFKGQVEHCKKICV